MEEYKNAPYFYDKPLSFIKATSKPLYSIDAQGNVTIDEKFLDMVATAINKEEPITLGYSQSRILAIAAITAIAKYHLTNKELGLLEPTIFAGKLNINEVNKGWEQINKGEPYDYYIV